MGGSMTSRAGKTQNGTAAAAEEPAAVDDKSSKSKGIFGMLKKIADKVLAKGPHFVLAYILIDVLMYSVVLLFARSAYKLKWGQEPWKDPKAFIVMMAGIWAANNWTKPLRIAGAAALALPINRAVDTVDAKLDLAKRIG